MTTSSSSRGQGKAADKDETKPDKVVETVTETAIATSPEFEEAAAEAEGARRKAHYGDGEIELKLAHPLSAEVAYALGLGAQELLVNTVVRVNRGRARQLINAGLVQVDPEDRQAVYAVLKVSKDDPREHYSAVAGGRIIPGV